MQRSSLGIARSATPAVRQDEGVRCSAKSDPDGEEAYRAVSNHEAPDGNDGCLKI